MLLPRLPKVLTLLLTTVLVGAAAAGGVVSAQSGGSSMDGDGDGLIEINNLEQLDAMRYDLNGDGAADSESGEASYAAAFPAATGIACRGCAGFELAGSLDFKDPGSYASGRVNTAWTAGKGWQAIRKLDSTFDGNANTISNLYINQGPTQESEFVMSALFVAIGSTGTVRNLGLVDVDVRGARFGSTSGLAAFNRGVVSGSYVTGAVSGGGAHTGGLVGANYEGASITLSYATGSITVDSDFAYAGGLVGSNYGAISASYATGDVSVTNSGERQSHLSAGGLVGVTYGGSISASYSTGDVEVGGKLWLRYAGGLVGNNSGAIVSSYSTGRATAGPVFRSPGDLTSPGGVGGLAGVSEEITLYEGHGSKEIIDVYRPSIRSSYWDTQTSGQSIGVGDGDSSGVTGKTTSELQSPTSYTGIYAAWDETEAGDVWDFGTSGEYPKLKPIVFEAPKPAPVVLCVEDLGSLTAAVERQGNWAPGCESANKAGRHARFYIFSLGQDRQVTVDLESSLDSVLNLLQGGGTEGEVLANSDDVSSASNNSRIVRTFGRGTYTVEATTFGPAAEGDFTLTITPAPAGGDPPLRPVPGTCIENLGVLSDDIERTGSWTSDCASRREPDTYARYCGFSLEEEAEISVDLGSSVDPVLYLDGTSVTERVAAINDDVDGSSGSRDSRIMRTLGTGAYTIEAATYEQMATGSFTLSITFLGAEPERGDHPDDLAALRALYHATGGPNWRNKENWLEEDVPVEDWHGVRTDRTTGRVASLILRDNNLGSLWRAGQAGATGELPPEMGGLAGLTTLDLRDNRLQGELPPEMGNLSNLKYLNLRGNQLSGRLPYQWGSLAGLVTLNLRDNRLEGAIPWQLGNLTRLQYLYLGKNNLSGSIPYADRYQGRTAGLESLRQLRALHLSDNNLTGSVPANFGLLGELTHLYLNNNRLSGEIPDALGRLDSLQVLTLSHNGLDGEIPSGLEQLGNLEALYINDNRLEGEVPEWLGNLRRLELLYLHNNRFTGCVPYVLKDLLEASLGPSYFADPSRIGLPEFCPNPEALSDLEVLRKLYEATNGSTNRDQLQTLHQEASDELERRGYRNTATQLRDIELTWTTGNFDFDAFTSNTSPRVARILKGYSHSYEEVNGWKSKSGWADYIFDPENPLPFEEWYGVQADEDGRVTAISLPDNNLRGYLPGELGQLDKLQYLDLGENLLAGYIPPELGSLNELRYLWLDHNDLYGPIPRQLSRVGSLNDLDLSHNHLDGDIPEGLGRLRGLNALSLNSNRLHGPLPPEIGGLRNLYWLDLSDNRLGLDSSGNQIEIKGDTPEDPAPNAIPKEWDKLRNLEVLILRENDLYFHIPEWLGDLDDLNYLDVFGNEVDGCIPTSLVETFPLSESTGLNSTEQGSRAGWLDGVLRGLQAIESFVVDEIIIGGVVGLVNNIDRFDLISDEGTESFVSIFVPRPVAAATAGIVNLGEGGYVRVRDWVIDGRFDVWLPPCAPAPDYLLVKDSATGDNEFGSVEDDELALRSLFRLRNSSLEDLRSINRSWGNNWTAGFSDESRFTGEDLGVLDGVVTDNGRVIALELGGMFGESDDWNIGQVPPELGNLGHLQKLDLSNNSLEGRIPEELGNIPFLRELNLSGNQLYGSVPPEIGNLLLLQVLDLRDNELFSHLPRELGNLRFLTGLYLSGNDLGGCLPEIMRESFEESLWVQGLSVGLELLPLTGTIEGVDDFLKRAPGYNRVFKKAKIYDFALADTRFAERVSKSTSKALASRVSKQFPGKFPDEAKLANRMKKALLGSKANVLGKEREITGILGHTETVIDPTGQAIDWAVPDTPESELGRIQLYCR